VRRLELPGGQGEVAPIAIQCPRAISRISAGREAHCKEPSDLSIRRGVGRRQGE